MDDGVVTTQSVAHTLLHRLARAHHVLRHQALEQEREANDSNNQQSQRAPSVSKRPARRFNYASTYTANTIEDRRKAYVDSTDDQVHKPCSEGE